MQVEIELINEKGYALETRARKAMPVYKGALVVREVNDHSLGRHTVTAHLESLAYPPGAPAQDVHPDLFIDKRLKSEPNVLYEGVPLDVVTRDLLSKLEMGLQSDELERSAAIVALERLRDEGQTSVDVFLIGNGHAQNRSKKSDNAINQVAQGKSPAGKVDTSLLTYGGDRSFVAPERVSLHLRYFNLLNAGTKLPEEQDVPWFAVHIPEKLEKNFLLQKDAL